MLDNNLNLGNVSNDFHKILYTGGFGDDKFLGDAFLENLPI